LRRGEYFAALFAIGCTSGLTSWAIQSVTLHGWRDAVTNTFDISAIIWIACILGVSLVLRERTIGIGLRELILGAGFVFLAIIPVGPLSWFAVTALSLYILAFTRCATSRRGACILLATTVPMLWSRLLFQFFARPILVADASLVSWLLGTHRTGNLVEFADNSGQLVILPACSSFANVSLALVCWVFMSELLSHKKSAYDFLWCLLASASVVAVNVARLDIMGLSQWHYAMLHNHWSDALGSMVIFGLIIGITALGVRRELFRST
jgi:hypothetical protein